jgi:hypothetical protein
MWAASFRRGRNSPGPAPAFEERVVVASCGSAPVRAVPAPEKPGWRDGAAGIGVTEQFLVAQPGVVENEGVHDGPPGKSGGD